MLLASICCSADNCFAAQDAGRKRKAPDSEGDAVAAPGVTQAQVVPVPPPPVVPGI